MSTEVSADADSEVYDRFLERVKRLSNVSNAADVLNWDQEIVMPEGGTPARSQQLAALSAVRHELLTSDEMGEYLTELRDTDLDDEQQAVVREVSRVYDRQTSVPESLVEEISQTTSEAHPVWKNAKENDDFSEFAPTLERLVELKREYAEHIDPDADPYAVLFAEYEPYLDLETADEVLTQLREELVVLIEEIEESDADLATGAVSGTFAEDTQEEFVRQVLDVLGYDWDHGRLDTAPHPFSSGNTFDARVSTRFDESELLGALMSTIHEFGHATYTLGLPEEHYATPLGKARNLSVHESQSRFWENHVGRTRAFWERILPTVTERFPQLDDLTVEEAYQAANQVYEDNLIRVEADELTYHLHIVIRYEIERALINGEIDVEEIPQVWNDKYEEYLGVRPDTDAEGCLQDIHWSHGSFGYFPTYSLGSVMAAQIDAAMRDTLDVDELVRTGEFDPIHDWLTERIHQHGCRYTTDELVEQATGESFTAEYFLEYVEEKYGALYDL
jgi:carboxypeptidase Taq